MKHKKKIIAGVAALALAIGISSVLSGASTAGGEAKEENSAGTQSLTVLSASANVPSGVWYEDAALWCEDQEIFTADSFSPDAVMTRGAVAEALYRSQGSPDAGGAAFPDISANSQYAKAAAWMAENGIMSGYTDGRFGADDPVTREQMAAVFWRYAGSPPAAAGEDFADEHEIAAFAQSAVDWARSNGVINGKPENRFDPKGWLTQAQTAVILHRCLW